MKKVLQILVAAVLAMSLVGFVGSTANAASCDGNFTITGTGPDSNNTIECTDISTFEATCDNNVIVLNYNDQEGNSGSATVSSNTSGDSAVSGTITNDNETTIDLATVCVPAQGETTVTTTTPQVPAAPVTPAAAQKVTALPYTAGSTALENGIVALIVILAALATLRIGVVAYRRIALK